MDKPLRKVDEAVYLVAPEVVFEGEALELNDENVGKAPQRQLLGRLDMSLAIRTVPVRVDQFPFFI